MDINSKFSCEFDSEQINNDSYSKTYYNIYHILYLTYPLGICVSMCNEYAYSDNLFFNDVDINMCITISRVNT